MYLVIFHCKPMLFKYTLWSVFLLNWLIKKKTCKIRLDFCNKHNIVHVLAWYWNCVSLSKTEHCVLLCVNYTFLPPAYRSNWKFNFKLKCWSYLVQPLEWKQWNNKIQNKTLIRNRFLAESKVYMCWHVTYLHNKRILIKNRQKWGLI